MKEESFFVPAKDGYPLSVTVFKPESEPKAVIQLNSGTGIPKKFYGNSCRFLTENRYLTVTFDYRGIGGSTPDNLNGSEASTTDWRFLDASGIFDWVNSEFPTKKKNDRWHELIGILG